MWLFNVFVGPKPGGGGGGGRGVYLNATLGALCSCMWLFNVFVGGLFL